MIIQRAKLMQAVQEALVHYPVTFLLGPRQCGKTTLAREIWKFQGGTYFDLEDPNTPLKPDTANITLKKLKGLVVIDEFQRQPGLFPLLRVLADRRPIPARFLILGSASPYLVKGISESLAGRVAYVGMDSFSFLEIKPDSEENLWVRGGFPVAYLAKSNKISNIWRSNFIQSFLERDIPQLGIRLPSYTLRRFWMMVAHYHGNIWNASDFARSLGLRKKQHENILISLPVRLWFASFLRGTKISPRDWLNRPKSIFEIQVFYILC